MTRKRTITTTNVGDDEETIRSQWTRVTPSQQPLAAEPRTVAGRRMFALADGLGPKLDTLTLTARTLREGILAIEAEAAASYIKERNALSVLLDYEQAEAAGEAATPLAESGGPCPYDGGPHQAYCRLCREPLAAAIFTALPIEQLAKHFASNSDTGIVHCACDNYVDYDGDGEGAAQRWADHVLEALSSSPASPSARP